MTLYLVGHDYRFSTEEGVVSFLGFKPDETVVCDHPPKNAEDAIVSRLTLSGKRITATAKISFGGRSVNARSYASIEGESEREIVRLSQHALKIALYKAARVLRGSDSDDDMPWGSLSGMRPSKLAMAFLEKTGSRRATERLLTKKYLVAKSRANLVLDAAEQGLRVKNSLLPNEISLYLGVPFCPTRCAYCSFVSASVERFGALVSPYVDALLSEIARRGALVKELGVKISTLYIGGGTPTTLSAEELEKILGTLEATFDLSYLREYTVEAGRPDTITAEKLDVLKRHNVTRISINPQSMIRSVLDRAARPHTPEDVISAFRLARATGFDCINMDLIAGLPGDSAAGFRESLERILSLNPENVTVHTLALKRGADLREDKPAMTAALLSRIDPLGRPDEQEVGEMLAYSIDRLVAENYAPYYLYRQKYMAAGLENTGWAKPGHEGIYNICIMEEFQSILSLGAGGMTKLVCDGKILRLSNPKYPKEYIENDTAAHDEKICSFYDKTT